VPLVDPHPNGRACAISWPALGLELLVEEGVAVWVWRGRMVAAAVMGLA
jgi:hypothetical protein